MTIQTAWQNIVGPPSTASEPSAITEGFPFVVANDISATALALYRSATGINGMPSQVCLYNMNTGQQVAGSVVTTPNDNGAVGWQWSTLPNPVPLAAGVLYCVAQLVPAGRTIAYTGSGTRPSPPSFFTFPANSRYYASGGSWAFPATGDSGQRAYWIDVRVDDTASSAGGLPATSGTIDQGLFSWLVGTSDNQHLAGDAEPGLPDMTYQVVAATQTAVNNIPTATDTPWVDVLKLWKIAGALTDLEIAAWNAFAQRAPSQLTGSGGGGGSAFFGSGGHQVAQSAEDVLALAQLLVALKRNAMAGFPGSPWVMAATTSFDTDLAWSEPADLYVVSFTGLGSNIVNVSPGGVDVSYRLAWWAPLIGTFGQQRGFIDTPDAHLWRQGERMPGLLLHSVAGGAGTVQAWTYD